jgi:hypothetical protein
MDLIQHSWNCDRSVIFLNDCADNTAVILLDVFNISITLLLVYILNPECTATTPKVKLT